MIHWHISRESALRRCAGWYVGCVRAPFALIRAQSQLQYTTFEEEVVPDPVSRVLRAVQCRLLDINVLVRRVKIDIADRCIPTRQRVTNANLLEKGRRMK